MPTSPENSLEAVDADVQKPNPSSDCRCRCSETKSAHVDNINTEVTVHTMGLLQVSLNVNRLLGHHSSAVVIWFLDPPYIDLVGLVRALTSAYVVPAVTVGVMVRLDVGTNPLSVHLQIIGWLFSIAVF